MIQYTCDCCGKVMTPFEAKGIDFPCHICEEKIGYLDKDMQSVSGRTVEYHMCSTCYNKVWSAAWKELKASTKSQ